MAARNFGLGTRDIKKGREICARKQKSLIQFGRDDYGSLEEFCQIYE